MGRKAVVVGGGISGLLSALALGKEGWSVTLLEKDEFLGGNCRSYEVDGFQVDTGPHAITYVHDGPLKELMEKYFARKPEILPYGEYYVRSPGKFRRFPWTIQDWLKFDILPSADRRKLVKTMGAAMLKSAAGKANLNSSLYDYLGGQEFFDETWKFVDALAYFMSGRGMTECPAWRMLKGARYLEESEAGGLSRVFASFGKLKKLFSYNGVHHQGYPKQGLGDILDALLESVPETVELNTNEPVQLIKVEGGSTKSVLTASGEYEADAVVYTAPVRGLPEILDAQLPQGYEDNLKNLKYTKTLTLWLGLSEKIPELDYVGSEIWFARGKPYWAMPTTGYNSSFAPEGKQLCAFASFIEGDDVKKEEKLLKETIFNALPSLEKNIVFEHGQVTVPEKAAITVGSKFPGVESPIRGLYLAGTDTDPRSMGVTRAAFSVQELLKSIQQA